MMESAVLEFWRGYLDTLLPDLDQPRSAGVFSFGDSKKLADELAALVRQGIKTATCSALMSYKKIKTLPLSSEAVQYIGKNVEVRGLVVSMTPISECSGDSVATVTIRSR